MAKKKSEYNKLRDQIRAMPSEQEVRDELNRLERKRKKTPADAKRAIQLAQLAFGYLDMHKKDSSAVKAENVQLLQDKMFDTLTGLYSLKFFKENISKIHNLAKHDSGTYAVLFVDIDKFKSINDRYDHAGGDEALRHVARILKETQREGDYVCRYGGEEIVIILPGCNKLEDAAKIAEKIRAKIETTPCDLSIVKEGLPKELPITASFGAAVFDRSISTWQELVARADRAMYVAKGNADPSDTDSRNRVAVYEASGDAKVMPRGTEPARLLSLVPTGTHRDPN